MRILENLPLVVAVIFIGAVAAATDDRPVEGQDSICSHSRWDASVSRVVDGDTIDLNIDLEWDVYTHQRIRIYGVDTPEVRGEEREDGLRVKQFVQDRINEADSITVGAPPNDGLHRGRYGRYIASICLDGKDLTEILLETGNGEPY